MFVNSCFTKRDRRGRDRFIVGFTTIYAISAYHHLRCEFELRSGEVYSIQHDKVCQWLATCQWFSSGTPVYSTNKTDCHDITEILLKVALNTINPTFLLNWLLDKCSQSFWRKYVEIMFCVNTLLNWLLDQYIQPVVLEEVCWYRCLWMLY